MSAPALRARVLTSTALIVGLTVVLSIGGWATFGAALAVSALGLLEFYGMFWKDGSGLGKKVLGLALAAGIFLAAESADPAMLILAVTACLWAGNLFFLVCYAQKPDEAHYPNAAVLTAGLLYVALPLALFIYFKPVEIVFVLLLVVATDTGGYFAGCRLGGPKVWPTISPKKTWAGSFGGLALSLALALTYGGMLGSASWKAFLLTGLVLNLSAQFGDFFESALKRMLGVKDSGTILPGHGGVLDRIDGLLLAVPAYAGLRAVAPLF